MEVIYEKNLILTPENEKTNVPLEFFVEGDFSKLEIFYEYTPKILEDREKSLMQKFRMMQGIWRRLPCLQVR